MKMKNFSLHYHYLFKHSSDENKGRDLRGKDVLIFKQILLTGSIRNVWRTIRRIQIIHSYIRALRVN